MGSTGFLSRLRVKLSVAGEHGAEGLLGTMIAVLFLAVITGSFAGIYMAYTVTTNKASENVDRVSVLNSAAEAAEAGMFVDGETGAQNAAADGWTVVADGVNLSTVVPSGLNSEFASYQYAATKPLGDTGTILISQWGVLGTSGADDGVVKIYTATPKAGFTDACNWTTSSTDLQSKCLVNYKTVVSVLSPPDRYEYDTYALWRANADVFPWTTTTDYSLATNAAPITVNTRQLGTVDISTAPVVGSNRMVPYVISFSNLTVGQQLAVRLYAGGTATGQTLNWTVQTADAGKKTLTGYATFPSGTTTMDVFLDTNLANPTTNPNVRITTMLFYKMHE